MHHLETKDNPLLLQQERHMKITIVKEEIIEGLQKAANIIPVRSGAAYLRSVWLHADGNSVSIMATDANIEFCGIYPAQVEEGGLVGVHGRAFVDLVKQLPNGPIQLSLDAASNTLLLEQGRRKYSLAINDSVWFQNFSPFPTENAVIWSGDFLQDILDKVTFCISDDDAMDAIACLYIKPIANNAEGRIEVCGLNGHQFAMIGFNHDELKNILPEDGILLQKKYLQELKKWLGSDEIELNISDKRFYVRTLGAQEIISLPRATHTFPDYMPFLDKINGENSTVSINRKECAESLGRINIFNTNNNRCTYFDLSAEEALLSAQGQEIGYANENIEIRYDGDIKRIAFPTKDLMDIMGHFNSEDLTMTLTGPEGPCAVRGKDDLEYIVIIMPMKITDTNFYNEDDV